LSKYKNNTKQWGACDTLTSKWKVCAVPPDIQKYLFVMLLDASLRPLLDEAAHVVGYCLIYNRYVFFFPFFSLFSPKNNNLAVFVVDISTSILLLLISDFFSWLFSRSFICF
jgi:uncharacterized membrane protein